MTSIVNNTNAWDNVDNFVFFFFAVRTRRENWSFWRSNTIELFWFYFLFFVECSAHTSSYTFDPVPAGKYFFDGIFAYLTHNFYAILNKFKILWLKLYDWWSWIYFFYWMKFFQKKIIFRKIKIIHPVAGKSESDDHKKSLKNCISGVNSILILSHPHVSHISLFYCCFQFRNRSVRHMI